MPTCRSTRWIACLVACSVLTGLHTTASGQMEKRSDSLYRSIKFACSKPYNNQVVPNFKLRTLDNQEVQLKDYFGKPLVIIKAGYT